MATPSFFSPGWVKNPAAVEDVKQARCESGNIVTAAEFSSRKSIPLAGSWQRFVDSGGKGIFLRDYEVKLLGGYRRPYFQKFGTCVSRGMARGLQTSLDYSIVKTLSMLKPVTVAFAPIYTLARVEIGKYCCGNSDGAILAHAAQAVHQIGVATEDLFQGCSEDETEKLAVHFAAPGYKTPRTWLEACIGHTATTFWPDTLDLLFDCIAAGYAVPYAMSYITGLPDRNGLSDLGDYGPHCRCFTGAYLDEHGERQLESSESWGCYPAESSPRSIDQTCNINEMPRVQIKYAGGLKTLAPGNVGVNAKRFWSQIQDGGEAWTVSPPNFESTGLADAATRSTLA